MGYKNQSEDNDINPIETDDSDTFGYREHVEPEEVLATTRRLMNADWSAGFEAGLRAADIQQSEDFFGQTTPLKLDPTTLSVDERAFYDCGYDDGWDAAFSEQIEVDENDISETLASNGWSYIEGYDASGDL